MFENFMLIKKVLLERTFFGVLRFLSVTTDILTETNSNSNSFSLQLQSADPQYWFTLQQ